MKISIKELRQIVRETIDELNEASDKELAIGDEVSIVVGSKPMKGKIINKYSSKFADPMAKGVHMPHQSGRMMWSVEVGTRIYQVPADELEIVRSKRKAIEGLSNKPKKTQEALNTLGRSSMLHGGKSDNDGEPTDDHDEDDILLDDEELCEADKAKEDKEADLLDEFNYDMLARSIAFNWNSYPEEMNWRRVAQNYVNAKKTATGKTLDVEKLYKALTEFMETDGDKRNQTLFGGTGYNKSFK